jgi:GDPmannose 4,6-dehydratase
MANTALITGVTGQDGSYLAELLLAKGYRVCGLIRPAVNGQLESLPEVCRRVELFEADLLDQGRLEQLAREIQPTEVYNLAAMTFVPASWQQPLTTLEFNLLSVARLLEALRRTAPKARFFQASTAELFGQADHSPQNERTPLRPRSPYGASKACAHHITISYRDCFGLFTCSGILYNHESPRRSPEFVTRKITATVAKIKLGLASELRLGNLQAVRDWGFAGDYVRAMWLMLQHPKADDYVIGTGRAHTVEDFVRTAFQYVGLRWQDYVVVDPQFFRPAEPAPMVADNRKLRTQLNWQPEVSLEELIRQMVDHDLAILSRSDEARAAGHS